MTALLPVARVTFARIHWAHDFTGRAPRVADNDDYWADVETSFSFASGRHRCDRGAAATLQGGAPHHSASAQPAIVLSPFHEVTNDQ